MTKDYILRINMNTGIIQEDVFPEKYHLLGGRALTARLLLDETDPNCDPLAEKSTLFIAPGLLGATAATTSGRTSFGFKSPLTGGTKESNVGGQLGHRLARLGIKAIAITGSSPDKWMRLDIDSTGARLSNASDLIGKRNYELHTELVGESLRNSAAATIGPAGEFKLAAASIAVTDPEGRPTRHAARGGPGAVMGAKGLKAIVVNDSGVPRTITAINAKEYKAQVVGFSKTVLEDPRVQNTGRYGTAGVIKFVNRENIQSLPVRNHRLGVWEENNAEQISGQHIALLGEERGGKMLPCMAGCIIKCAILFNNADGEHLTTALEFETLALLGSNLEIGPADAVAELDRLCDDVGLDTIEVGNAIGLAMEAGELNWGDWEKARNLIDVEIAQGTKLGNIIGNGTVHTANHYGITRIPAVKGQGLPAWEPRTLKGMGITYATSPQGADHTAGMVTTRKVNPKTLMQQSRHEQLVMMAIDSAGLCQFTNALPSDIAIFMGEQYGLNYTQEDVLTLAREAIQTELNFNHQAGLGPETDKLPSWLYEEPLELPDGPSVFDLPEDLIAQIWND